MRSLSSAGTNRPVFSRYCSMCRVTGTATNRPAGSGTTTDRPAFS